MRRVRGAFLLNFPSFEYTLGVCDYRALLAPDHLVRSTTYSTAVGFGDKIDTRKMTPFRGSGSYYFRTRPPNLLGH